MMNTGETEHIKTKYNSISKSFERIEKLQNRKNITNTESKSRIRKAVGPYNNTLLWIMGIKNVY